MPTFGRQPVIVDDNFEISPSVISYNYLDCMPLYKLTPSKKMMKPVQIKTKILKFDLGKVYHRYAKYGIMISNI